MEAVARLAGVGVGTLYRRFQDRDALIRAVAVESIRHVLDESRRITAKGHPPWEALTQVLRSSIELRVIMQLAVSSPRARAVLTDDPEIAESRQAIFAVLDGIVRAAHADGSLRADIDTGDIVLFWARLLRGGSPTIDRTTTPVLERCLALMLDGLRAGRTSTLPGTPISPADLAFREPDSRTDTSA
jgi:AcrR family transcriptional regulator